MSFKRNDGWKDDEKLEEALNLYVGQGIQRREMLDFLRRDFSEYTWSIPSLDRRLRHFNIYYTDNSVTVEEVIAAVKKEIDGPGALLGYRAMHKKIRQTHQLRVPRDLVYTVMTDIDPEGLENRSVGKKKKPTKGRFSSNGPNWVHSVDGHDKMMGFQNSTFPLAVYGCLDTCSRKLLWLKVWSTNKNPKLIGCWYLQHLVQTKCISTYIRMDRGTETGTMATIHAYLHRNHDEMLGMNPEDTILYGPSTSNQIERWWKELHERLEKYFKSQLNSLKDQGLYNPHNERDRSILAYVMIPLLQKELDIFKDEVWNPHRIRLQKNTDLPNGIPNHIYSFPDQYGLVECGWEISDGDLEEVANLSGVLDAEEDYLTPDFRRNCERLLSVDEVIEPSECCDAYLYLKDRLPLT